VIVSRILNFALIVLMASAQLAWAAGKNSDSAVVLVPLTQIDDDGAFAEIVNGLTTSKYPSVVALVDNATGTELCTGTFIGCETVLTAASCVCSSLGGNCQTGGPDLLDPTSVSVFSQHAGFFSVASIEVPVDYDLGVAADVAILRLSAPVTGIAPSTINSTMRPAAGTAGTIVGFGETQGNAADNGVKREGDVVTTTCTQVPDSTHVCWLFEDPTGNPGTDSSSCAGDSGGPLFVDFGAGPVVAGVTSGGFNPTCLPDREVFDSDVYVYRSWIETTGGADLLNRTCGDLSQAGTSGAPIGYGQGTLSSFNTSDDWVTIVPPATETLRVTINGEDGSGNDFDLYVNYGTWVTIQDYDCGSTETGTPEFCEFPNPTPGKWYFLPQWVVGSGLYQITVVPYGPTGLIFSDGFESGDTSRWTGDSP